MFSSLTKYVLILKLYLKQLPVTCFSDKSNNNYTFHALLLNMKQIFHAFLFNIRNYSPELRYIQRRKGELNVTLPRVNNFGIKQEMAWNIYFIINPKH